ncbi:sperm-associated antigen 17 isoform X3 [Ictalurus furcatus]|uniref:sperm-associated antigen 17 isoform X3 n=1 Tax=Ictalurus furcatus TaxID=66913 RepID=UPI0023506B59|nr:sperm-associated antigen 17 isoform X3 [Ictalurus furcatus]
MAPKRGKNERDGSAGVAASKPWEAALSSAVLQEECWCVCVSLVVCDSVYDEVCMRALCHAVQQPLRCRFTLLSWENLLQKVNDLGNPKTRKIKELPAFYEVTEVARSVLDSGYELSVDLLAKLVKFQLLEIKNTDIQRRAAVQREAGSESPGREKNAKGLAKGEKGKKAAEAPPPRKDTKLKRRGDDNTSSYIDDEPDDGPEHYVLMTGFHQPSLISALDSIGVHVSNVIRLKSDRSQNSHVAQEEERTDTPKEHESSAGASALQQDLSVFWDQLDGVLNSAGFQSRLSDVARLDYRVDQNLLSRDLTTAEGMQEVGVAMFEGVACLLYDSLDWRRQHEHYLSRMRLIHIPNIHTPEHSGRPDTSADAVRVRREADGSAECVDVDMRLYSDLLDRIPLQCVSVPLVLHCLIEQVVSSEQEVCGGSAESESSSDPEHDLICYMMRCVRGLPRSEQENSELMEYFGIKEEDQSESKERSPTVLHHHDERSKRLHHMPVLDSLDAVSVEVCMMKKSSVWNTLMSKHLDTNSLNTARRHELLHYCSTDSLSSADVQRLLQICVFESMPLTAVDASGGHTLAASHTALPWDDPVTFTHTVYCGLDTTHESTVGCDEQQENKVSVEDLQKTLIRHFRHWNFTEHHNAEVFPQVLQTASESYRCVDSFHSCQSNIMYVFCHNPMSPERSSRGSWEVSLHTDVRFRSYLENVAESIRDWSRTEEERLQKQQQQQQQQQQQETETLDTTTKGVSVVSPVPERSEVFIRHNSLKLEQDRQKDDEVMRNMKKEKGGKSSAKGGERVESSPEDEHHTPHTSTDQRSDMSEAPTHTHNQPVFTGYRMDGRLVQVRGESQCVYPSDGGQISVERFHYVQGSTQLKVCVRKDGHCFYTHIREPETQNTNDQRRKFGCFYAVLSNGLTIAYSHAHQEVDDAPLQLHVSLPTGLQIHFSFQHRAHGQAVLVCQSLPSSGSKLPATHTESSRTITCEGAVIKHMRDGSTVVLFADGTVSVSPDSGPVCVTVPTSAGQDEDTSTHTQGRDTKVKPRSGVGVEGAEPTSKVELKEQVKMTGGSWCTTTPSGVRIRTMRGDLVEENPVLTFYSTDPQTHSVVMSRDDGVLCVLEKHRAVVDHADGTRISSSYQQGETVSQQRSGSSSDGGRVSMVKVEKSGFATVMMKCEEKSSEVLFRDGTTISATAHGSYRVCLPDGGCLSLREDGVAVYSSTGPEGDQHGRYIMSHSEGLVCELTDSEGNHYQVTAEGGVSISHTPTDTESQTQHNIGVDTHTPRLFIVCADGSALEFLSPQTVDEILQKENTDPSVAVIREPIPHTHEAFAVTILKPFSDLSSYWLSPKHPDDIIPANLKSRKWDTFPASEVKTHGSPFGVSLGRGLELKERTTLGSDPTPPVLQNPNTLLIRRITEHTPFTQQHYEDLQHKLLLYINQLLQREKLKDEMKLKDPQTVAEKLHHTDLHPVQSQPDATPDATPQSMLSLYSQAVGVSHSPLSNQHSDQQVTHRQQKQKSEWGKRIHQHRLDLQEETRHRYALRNHIITPYFHPELQELTRHLHQEVKVTSLSPNLPSFPKRRNAGLQNFSNSF